MNFTKMHGSGNDYIYVDCFRESVSNPEKLAVRLSDRHKGIGSDGLVLIMPSENSDLRMRMFNADGSEAQMCGNASRCVGKYAYDNGLTHKTELTLETSAGEKKLWLIARDQKVERVKVDMGEPVLDAMDIPVKTDMDRVLNRRTVFPRLTADISCVSMGNPHTVIFTNDIDHLSLNAIGPGIENHSLFPERTNVEFVEVVSPQHARMRVWERGAGETQACGTGACAVLVAGVLNKFLERRAIIDLPGGSLEIEWDISSNHVYMTGDAVTVFKGQIDI